MYDDVYDTDYVDNVYNNKEIMKAIRYRCENMFFIDSN